MNRPAVVKQVPNRKRRKDPAKVSVAFLASRPEAALVKSIEDADSGNDELAVGTQEIFLHFPDGCARTKLTNAFFERELNTTATARNWRTVEALEAIAAST